MGATKSAKGRAMLCILVTFGVMFTGASVFMMEQLGYIDLNCPVWAYLKLACPGCGVTRLVVSILKMELEQAFRWNPMIFMSIPLYIYIWLHGCSSYIKNGEVDNEIQHSIMVYAIMLILFGIVRNIGIFNFLMPTKI